MLRAQIREEIAKIVGDEIKFSVEASDNPEHGDYSSNAALVIAKQEGRNPKEVAEKLKNSLLSNRVAKLVERIEVAGPGFLNFFISSASLRTALLEKLSDKKFGLAFSGSPKRINLEFVSANPTGPLTMANGRGGFYGDVLANILEAVGHKVTREYYINDAGNQVRLLGESIEAAEGKREMKEEYYQGEYIKDLAGMSSTKAIQKLLKDIKISLKKAGIKFNVWFSEEKKLRKTGEFKKTLQEFKKKGLIEKRDGAVWFGDRVLIKSGGDPTYLLVDIAYLHNKIITRKFDEAIIILGADHHAEAEQVKKCAVVLGIPEEKVKIFLLQLVRLVSQGKEVRMSKRSGKYVMLDELLEQVPVDVARWFFLERTLSTHMDFDLDLAKERSKKNPVYYVQYAHARGCSILSKAKIQKLKVDLKLLSEPEELALIKKILQIPEIIEDISTDYQVNRLTRYTYELARMFTNFYEKHKIINEKNPELTGARLFLVSAAKETLAFTLSLMGISAPKKM